MANKDDIVTIIKNRTRVIIGATTKDEATQAEIDKEIDRAVRNYSMSEPRTIHEDKTVADLTDVADVKFFDLDKWDEHTSDESEIEIEFPIDLPRKTILRRGHDLDWIFEERPVAGVRKFFIRFFAPPSGAAPTEPWRIKYMTRWPNLAEEADLVPLDLRAVDLVGLLASVYVARMLSARFGKTGDTTMDSDVTDYRSKAAEWRDIANESWKEYKETIDPPTETKRAGQDMDIVDLDTSLGRSNRFGSDFLVHKRRRR